MTIDEIKNGIVIDHIKAGKGMYLYNVLGLEKLDCSVALITKGSSQKMGTKDIIKSKILPAQTINIIVNAAHIKRIKIL